MLDVIALQEQLAAGFANIVPGACTAALKTTFPEKTEIGDETAAMFGTAFGEMFCEPMAMIIANAIDAYVKNISIFGTITVDPAMHTAIITSLPTPPLNGTIPNTLGIM